MRNTFAKLLSGFLPATVASSEEDEGVFVLVIVVPREGDEFPTIHISTHSTEVLAKRSLCGYISDFAHDAASPEALKLAQEDNDVDAIIRAYFFGHYSERHVIVHCVVDKE